MTAKKRRLTIKGKKEALRVGFEPTRVNPSDFESDALTTRPSQHTMKKREDICTHEQINYFSVNLY